MNEVVLESSIIENDNCTTQQVTNIDSNYQEIYY